MSDEANTKPQFAFPEMIVKPAPLTLNQIWGDIIKPFTAIAPTNSAFIDATINCEDIGNGYTLDYNSNGILWRVNAAGIPHPDDLEKFNEQQEIIQGYSDNLAAEFNLNDTVGGIIEHWKSWQENQEKESLEAMAKRILELERVTPEDPLYEFKLQEAMNMLDEAQDSVIPGGMKFVRGLNGVIKGSSNAGRLAGSLDRLTSAERTVVNDLLTQGKNVEIIPTSTVLGAKTPDFLVNGVKTELKTLQNPNTNTGMKRIQEAFKQGAETVIIDARESGMGSTQAQEIINRAAGKYTDRQFPGRVEIWTKEGTITN